MDPLYCSLTVNREGKKESERGVYMREHVQDAHGDAYSVRMRMRMKYTSACVCDKRRERLIWSSEEESTVDALEPPGEEGRGKLRKASGRSTHPVIRGLPNGVTRPV